MQCRIHNQPLRYLPKNRIIHNIVALVKFDRIFVLPGGDVRTRAAASQPEYKMNTIERGQ